MSLFDLPADCGTVYRVARVPFLATGRREAAALVIDLAVRRVGIPIRLSNAYCVALAAEDPRYEAILSSPGINLPDGTPVAWAMRRVAKAKSARTVRGPSLFSDVMDKGRSFGLNHYLFGTTEETLSLLADSLAKEFSGVAICGRHAPGFGDLDETFYAEAEKLIRGSNPDIVWVGMGTPKQDYVTAELASRLGVPCVGVGAAFDFVAGTVREAPKFLHGTGFEWLFRLVSEPRRLWKRYLFGNFKFLVSVFRYR
ncbi:WecB/TagA/CpsF family glycosyltransferase [Rhodococcus hoagii]|nr:WecB/TagA/CpsF family glycosyltransferase [Prescottella equi]